MPLIEYGKFGEGGSGPLASLELGTKYTTTSFPEDLSESPYFILFRAKKDYRMSSLQQALQEQGPGPGGSDSTTGDVGGNSFLSKIGSGIRKVGKFFDTLENAGIRISLPSHAFALPIPASLQTGYNANYDSSTGLGAAGNLAKAAGEAFERTDRAFVEDLKSAVEKANISNEDLKGTLGQMGMSVVEGTDISTLVGTILGQAAAGGVGAGIGAAAGAAAGNIGRGALVGLGVARNPHLANIFQGVNFKTHSFQYKLIARSKKESDAIRDLIRNFKYHMAPSYKAGFNDHIFEYPSKFEIQMRAGDYLFEFGESVLTNFSVNYTGEGGPAFFEQTNAPYAVTIDLSFTETSIVTKKEIRQGR